MADGGDLHQLHIVVDSVYHAVIAAPGGPGWTERRVQRLADTPGVIEQRASDEGTGGGSYFGRK